MLCMAPVVIEQGGGMEKGPWQGLGNGMGGGMPWMGGGH